MTFENRLNSIKTKIIQCNENIASALETKGVTVPSDASIDDLSALVGTIETGGGGGTTPEDVAFSLGEEGLPGLVNMAWTNSTKGAQQLTMPFTLPESMFEQFGYELTATIGSHIFLLNADDWSTNSGSVKVTGGLVASSKYLDANNGCIITVNGPGTITISV